MIHKIRNFIQSLEKRQIIAYIVFLLLATIVFVGMTFFKETFQKIGYTLLLIELILLVTVAWALAGHAVMKSLFVVGASLSLIIFLSQAYCGAPNLSQAGNDALKTLIAFGFIYIATNFLRALYKEVTDRTKVLRQVNGGKSPWFFLVPFALFVGLFVWQIVQIIMPILQNLCIYQI
ncbi:hypothetical protein IT398_02215 [Candidatus Nomurabacteria bacterium]|nr:hypothetical protein [Candidatus Nomurabacteria bacterium]